MKETGVKIVGITLAFCIVLGYVNHVLALKHDDGSYCVTNFYELEKDTVDVLVLGSSHAFMSFNTGVLWREHGISSYVLSASAQPMWNSYYYLKEALKTQTPKLIVLEGYRVIEEDEYTSARFAIRSTYGLKWSRNKIDAIKASVPQGERLGFVLGYTQYHDRYTELSEEDFTLRKKAEKYEAWKGFEWGLRTTPVENADVSECIEYIDLMEKTEKYYRAIMELAQEHNIPIMVVIAPYTNMPQQDQKMYNSAQKIAEEYQVPFLNYNMIDLDIDYTRDMYDESHLNGRGSCKFTSKWGEYITQHYDFQDHRGDSVYDSWECDAQYLDALMEDEKMREVTEACQMPEYIVRDNYYTFVSIDGYCELEQEAVRGILEKLGISDAYGGGIWYFAGGEAVWSSGNEEALQYFETKRHDFMLKRVRNTDGGYENVICIDNQGYKIVGDGINVVIFDTVTGNIADAFGIDADEEYQLYR